MALLLWYGAVHKRFTDSGKRFNLGSVEAVNCSDREREPRALRHALDQIHLGEQKTAFGAWKDKNALQILSCRPRTARRAPGIRKEIIGRARGRFTLCFARSGRQDLAPLMFQKPSG